VNSLQLLRDKLGASNKKLVSDGLSYSKALKQQSDTLTAATALCQKSCDEARSAKQAVERHNRVLAQAQAVAAVNAAGSAASAGGSGGGSKAHGHAQSDASALALQQVQEEHARLVSNSQAAAKKATQADEKYVQAIKAMRTFRGNALCVCCCFSHLSSSSLH
jgi:hypothetical protein